jgi:hypothetical protein
MKTDFQQQTGFEFKEETSEVLHFEHSIVWRWNLCVSEKSEIPGKFWNLVVEKGTEDELDRSCEKRGSIKQNQGGEEYHTYNKRRKTNWIGHSLRRNCLLKHVIGTQTEGRNCLPEQLSGYQSGGYTLNYVGIHIVLSSMYSSQMQHFNPLPRQNV